MCRKAKFQVPNLIDDSLANMTVSFSLPFGALLLYVNKEIQIGLDKLFIPYMRKMLFKSGNSLTLAKKILSFT